MEQEKILKEFAEHLKIVLAKDYNDKARCAIKNLQTKNDCDYWFFVGQQTALQRIMNLLDKDLEKFLR